MGQHTRQLPRAYALSLWLRDQGCNREQIAAVLDIEGEAVNDLLRRAMGETPAGGGAAVVGDGVAVFAGGDDRVIDAASAVAEANGALFHVIALACKTGGDYDVVQASLLHAARRAMLTTHDVAPHAIASDAERAIRLVMDTYGVSMVVIGSNDPRRRSLERAALAAAARTVVVDDSGQVVETRSPQSRPPFARRLFSMGWAS